MNLRKQLETQLESVILMEDSENEELKVMERERTLEHRSPSSEAKTQIAVQEPYASRDKELLDALFKEDKPVMLEIRREQHEPSEYLVTLKRIAQPLQDTSSDTSFQFAPDWQLPIDPTVSQESLEEVFVLKVPVLREEWFIHQYTPAEASQAYSLQQSGWSVVKKPLIKWVAEKPLILPRQQNIHPRTEENVIHDSWWSRFKERWSSARAKTAELKTDIELAKEDLITESEEAWEMPVVVPQISYVRVVSSFLVLALLVSVPAGAVSLSQSVSNSWTTIETKARQTLDSTKAALAKDPRQSRDEWSQVALQFSDTSKELNQVNVMAIGLAQLIPQTRSAYDSAKALLEAGQLSAETAGILSGVYEMVFNFHSTYPTESILKAKNDIDSASQKMDLARKALARVDLSILPRDKQPQVQTLIKSIDQGAAVLAELQQLGSIMPSILGAEHDRSYLFVFQNSAELRPSGGFLGSMAEVVFDRGAIKRMHVMGGGPYDLQGQLKTRTKAPEPLALVSSRWMFQDANWFGDFALSAKSILSFWSDAGQPTMDGVIAMNVDLLEGILEDTGPIELPEYGKTFTAQNVRQELQMAVEHEYDKRENAPKKIIGDLLPVIIDRVKTADKALLQKLGKRLIQALETKQIQVYFTREEEQAVFARFGWTGEWKKPIGDTFAVIASNIAGQKTDTVIQEQVTRHVNINEKGEITVRVELKREHQGVKGQTFTGVNNVAFIRFYAPIGSTLISSEGFNAPSSSLFEPVDPTDEASPLLVEQEKTTRFASDQVRVTIEPERQSFGGWVQVKPGETQLTTIEYQLPFTAFDLMKRWSTKEGMSKRAAYVSDFISQSGKARELHQTITYPKNWSVQWQESEFPDSLTWKQNHIRAILFETP